MKGDSKQTKPNQMSKYTNQQIAACGPVTEKGLIVPTILGESALTPMQLRYWRALAKKMAGRCEYVDPFRDSIRSLKSRGFYGRIYRASTGGKWGKSAEIKAVTP